MAISSPTPLPPTRTVAFTTPENYASRLGQLISLKNWQPLWCPTIIVETTPNTKSSLKLFLEKKLSLENFSALAFTSRTGISAFSEVLNDLTIPPLVPSGGIFTVSALGKDAELLDKPFLSRLCENSERIRILVPEISTPAGMVESLGVGLQRRVMCPVPVVEDLEEPPVVPDFLRALGQRGWVAVRVGAYMTRWAGANCAEKCAEKMDSREGLDAVVFTSTAEVEGMLKSLDRFRLDWETVRRRFPRMVVAAHGPVTATGAERLGVKVDVVSARFSSFQGVVDALESRWQFE